MTTARRPVLLLGCAALLAAGCAGTDPGAHGGPARNPGYDIAFDICKPGVKPTAQLYRVRPTSEAVVRRVVAEVAGNSNLSRDEVRRGCLDALERAGEQ